MPPSTCGNTPPKVCYTDDTVQDLYDVKYACTPDNDVEWKCLNFYQDKCGLQWNPPECDDWSPPTSDSSDDVDDSGSSDSSSNDDSESSHDNTDTESSENSSHDNLESSYDNMATESSSIGQSSESSSHDNSESSHDNTDTCSTIFDLACSTDGFDTFCGLLTSFDLKDAISGGSWTVFAPTD